MFELPDAKRVRRSELLDDHSLRSSSTIIDTEQGLYSKQLHLDLDFVDVNHDANPLPQNLKPNTAIPSTIGRPVGDDGSSESFEFRLFSTGSRADDSTRTHDPAPAQTPPPTPSSRNLKPGIHRIRIRSPTPLSSSASGDGAFVVPNRPQTYYFTHPSAADLDQKAAYISVAVSSAEVKERATKTRWTQIRSANHPPTPKKPGTALPWRVTHLHLPSSFISPLQLKHAPATIPQPQPQPPGRPTETKAKTTTRRTRAGKKRRLAIRTRYVATTAKAETERAKRTRRNREKKVKKKEREKKIKKQAVSEDKV